MGGQIGSTLQANSDKMCLLRKVSWLFFGLSICANQTHETFFSNSKILIFLELDTLLKLVTVWEDVRRERNTKNIITLKGQMISFAIEFAYGIFVVLLSNNVSFSDPSLMILIKIVGSTVISVVQLMSSHEMKRFIRQRFNMFWYQKYRIIWFKRLDHMYYECG